MKEYTKRKKGDSWEVIGHKGDVKGTHNTEKEADDQIAAIHANMKEAAGLLSPEIEEKIDWAFHPMTYDDNPNIHDPLLYIVKSGQSDIEDMGFAADLRSFTQIARGGFDEKDILGVFTDIEQAKKVVRSMISTRGRFAKKSPVKESTEPDGWSIKHHTNGWLVMGPDGHIWGKYPTAEKATEQKEKYVKELSPNLRQESAMKENFETEEQIKNTPRETKEAVLSAVFRKGENGEEPILDPSKLSDEELDGMIAEYGDIFSKQQESLKKGPQFFEEVVSVLEEEGASEQDIVEALALHGGLHLEEAREIHQDLKRIQ